MQPCKSIFRTIIKNKFFIWKNKINPIADYNIMDRPRRQDIQEKKYIETGSFYITKYNKFLEFKNRLCGKICMFELSEIESIDIDTIKDFKVAEVLMKEKLSND